MKSQKNFPAMITRTTFLVILLYFLGITLMKGQSSGEQISWDDDDEEEVVPEDAGVKYDEVLITLNGEEITLSENFEVSKAETLDIAISRLKPNSWVAIRIYKGAVMFKKMGWYANEKGELQLEVKSGKRKVKGRAELYYVPSNGKKKKREVKVVVQ